MYNYIMHPSSMRNQDNVLEMRSIEGAAGYGIYIMILELMRDAENYRIKNNPKLIAFAINELGDERVKRVINDYGLFKEDENNYISSPWLLSTLEELERKSKAFREAGRKGAAMKKNNEKTEQQESDTSHDHDQNNMQPPSSQAQDTLKPGSSQAQATLKPGSSINNINNTNKINENNHMRAITCDSGEVMSVEDLDAICRGKSYAAAMRYDSGKAPADGKKRNLNIVSTLVDEFSINKNDIAFLLAVTDFCQVGGRNLMSILKIVEEMKRTKFKPQYFGSYILKKLEENSRI